MEVKIKTPFDFRNRRILHCFRRLVGRGSSKVGRGGNLEIAPVGESNDFSSNPFISHR